MESVARIDAAVEPRPAPARTAHRSAAAAEEAPEEAAAKAEPVDRIRLPEVEGRIFQARLSYDPVAADVFVEILDPTTGEVIRRLPAERMADEKSAFAEGGNLLDRIA